MSDKFARSIGLLDLSHIPRDRETFRDLLVMMGARIRNWGWYQTGSNPSSPRSPTATVQARA